MKEKLIIDGNAIYEIDEECMRQLNIKKRENENSEEEEQEGQGCRTNT